MFRRPREITEEFSAGMAILNLLARYSFNFQTSFTSLLTFFSIYSNFACSLIPLICKIIGLSIFALYLYQLFRLFNFQTFSRGPSTFALWKEWGVRGGGGGAWPVSVGEVQHPLLRLIWFDHYLFYFGGCRGGAWWQCQKWLRPLPLQRCWCGLFKLGLVWFLTTEVLVSTNKSILGTKTIAVQHQFSNNKLASKLCGN